MAADGHAFRVLLLTSGPLDGEEGADTQLAMALAHAMPQAEHLWFRQWPGRNRPVGVARGRSVPIPSRDGVPHLAERLQVATAGAVLARHVDLVHAVMTIGAGFPAFSRLWPRLVGGRPILHTVPGVMDPARLDRSRPLGPTVALSEATAGMLGAAGFGEVRVIGPGVRLDCWPHRPRPTGELPTVLVTGHHDRDGGTYEAISSAAAAWRAGARFRLVLAIRSRPGQDVRYLGKALRARALQEGLHDVEVLGYVEDMSGLLAASDVLLYVPRALGGKADVPLTVLEALATGRPVILSDLPQFASLTDSVLRVPVGNCHHAGRLLYQLLDRPQWWEQLAKRGRTTVEERFGQDRFMSNYARLYQELLA
ncbi:glycosyltransferase [Streptomyces xiangluensis]|uniref:D-inositol 3-phosphate glycosyltransferase n=1 Tax=Streptomyces xiangluensis TaxID=2665720 RepID=A0ABV8Z858_9ACTN